MAAWVIPVVGITGGIGSGKTTLTRLFAKQGIATLDLDRVGRSILTYNTDVQAALCEVFGDGIMQGGSSINRVLLAKAAFQDQTSIDALNRIMHPAIEQYEMHWRVQQTTPFALVEASVLIESQQCARMDAIIVVLCHENTRRNRVLQRGKQTSVAFDAIIARQCSDSQRYDVADYIIENNHDLQHLAKQQHAVYQQLLGILQPSHKTLMYFGHHGLKHVR